jgi:hypothetical protein
MKLLAALFGELWNFLFGVMNPILVGEWRNVLCRELWNMGQGPAVELIFPGEEYRSFLCVELMRTPFEE